MGDFYWIKKGTRIVFKAVPLEMWKTGTVKEVKNNGVIIIKDRTDPNNKESMFVEYRYIVGEATDRITPYPFSWANVFEHLYTPDFLSKEAKNNI